MFRQLLLILNLTKLDSSCFSFQEVYVSIYISIYLSLNIRLSDSLVIIMVSFAKLVIFKGFGRASGLALFIYALSTLILLLA